MTVYIEMLQESVKEADARVARGLHQGGKPQR